MQCISSTKHQGWAKRCLWRKARQIPVCSALTLQGALTLGGGRETKRVLRLVLHWNKVLPKGWKNFACILIKITKRLWDCWVTSPGVVRLLLSIIPCVNDHWTTFGRPGLYIWLSFDIIVWQLYFIILGVRRQIQLLVEIAVVCVHFTCSLWSNLAIDMDVSPRSSVFRKATISTRNMVSRQNEPSISCHEHSNTFKTKAWTGTSKSAPVMQAGMRSSKQTTLPPWTAHI